MQKIAIFATLCAAFAARAVGAATIDVSITAGGFSPSNVNVTEGDTVRWTNNDSTTRNVSSNDHPSHLLYSPLNLGSFGVGSTVQVAFPTAGTYGYHDHLFPGHLGTVTVAAAPTGGGGGGGVQPPTVVLAQPNGGEKLTSGTDFTVLWTAGGADLRSLRLTLSTDGGATYPTVIASNEFHDGAYIWRVPTITSTSAARVKIEALGTGDVVLATDASEADFEIIGTAPVPEPDPAPAPAPTPAPDPAPAAPSTPPDPNRTGAFSPASATAATTSIDVDRGIVAATGPLPCTPGSRIKASQPAVYYCGADGKRYNFPNEKVYYSWFANFSGVTVLTDAQLAAVPLGGNVTYRPGVKMVKIQSDPKTYAVARGGLLRWVQTEAIASSLYGTLWNRKIDVVSDALFSGYTIGDPVTQ